MFYIHIYNLWAWAKEDYYSLGYCLIQVTIFLDPDIMEAQGISAYRIIQLL